MHRSAVSAAKPCLQRCTSDAGWGSSSLVTACRSRKGEGVQTGLKQDTNAGTSNMMFSLSVMFSGQL